MILEKELSLSLFAFLSHKIAADKKKQKNNDYTPMWGFDFLWKISVL